MNDLQILIADDHHVVRRRLKAMLLSQPGWQVCGEADTGRKAVAKAKRLQPDVAILDIGMPELNGLEAARRIRSVAPKTEILILTVHHSDQIVREVMDSGVRGYLNKSDSDRDLITAVENLAEHKAFFAAPVMEAILHRFDSRRNESVHARLTEAERQMIQAVAEGKSARAAASSLGISVRTAESLRASLKRKLQTHSVAELIRYAVRNQIIES